MVAPNLLPKEQRESRHTLLSKFPPLDPGQNFQALQWSPRRVLGGSIVKFIRGLHQGHWV
jgi:hypothetical protein